MQLLSREMVIAERRELLFAAGKTIGPFAFLNCFGYEYAPDGRQEGGNGIKKDEVLAAIPLVILTTSAHDTDKDFALQVGIKVVIKPSNQRHLVQVVGKLLTYC